MNRQTKMNHLNPVTSLPDMYAFQNVADRVLLQKQDVEMTVIYFNVVNFKLFNTICGHHQGDMSLHFISETINTVFPDDLIAHFGGDHFVVLTTDQNIAEKIETIYQQVYDYNSEVRLIVNAGIAKCTGANDILDYIEYARIACNTIKGEYNSVYATYTVDMSENLLTRKYVIDHLQQVIEEHRIEVHYMPFIRILSGDLCGFEALARWNDEHYGMLAPKVFVKTLEDAHLIHYLDLEVARIVIEQLSEVLKDGKEPVPVSINLSRLDFMACDIVGKIDALIEQYHVPRKYIDIEITERALSEDDGTLQKALQQFRTLGYHLWMDDFGSDYSSLNALKEYDFDVIKMDMQFLRTQDEKAKRKGRIILKSIVSMAKELGVQTLCEGVENEEDLQYLRDIGCEKAQGYYFQCPKTNRLSDALLSYENKVEKDTDCSFMDYAGQFDFSSEAPMAMFLRADGKTTLLQRNKSFLTFLEQLSLTEESIDHYMSYQNISIGRQFKDAVDRSFHTGKTSSLDIILNGEYCNFQITALMKNDEKQVEMVLVHATNLSRLTPFVNTDYLDHLMRNVYDIYERVDVIDIERNTMKEIYCNASHFADSYESKPINEGVMEFARKNIHPDDRERFLATYQPEHLFDKAKEHGKRYTFTMFRTRNQNDEYAWRVYLLMQVRMDGREIVLSGLCDVGEFADVIAKNFFAHTSGEKVVQTKNQELQLGMFQAVFDEIPLGVFWKDKERRFLGANKYFKEYYGFSSDSEFIGKTDEDMGWHVDPDPYMNDEIQVLHNGKESVNVPGRCISHGQMRNILATKKPLKHGNEIVGLLGYFVDVTNYTGAQKEEVVAFSEDATGLLSRKGFVASYQYYVRAFMQKRSDFGILKLDMSNPDGTLQHNNVPVVKKIANVLQHVAGIDASIAHIESHSFLIIKQTNGFTQMEQLQHHLTNAIMRELNDDEKVDISVRCWSYRESGNNNPEAFIKQVLDNVR